MDNSFDETLDILMQNFRMTVLYANLAIAHEKGEIDDEGVKRFKKIFDPKFENIANKLEEKYYQLKSSPSPK